MGIRCRHGGWRLGRRRSGGSGREIVLGAALRAVLTAAPLLAPWAGAEAQQPGARDSASDTLPVITLDEIVVTGARSATTLGASVAALTRVDAPDLDRLAGTSFADALRMVPGFALVDFDGTGYDPQLMVRGFYGGGEAEYVLVLLDGQPLNDLQTGLVSWDLVPPVAVRSVEVVRGGASALWGDAAMGGVINVLTRDGADGRQLDWELEGGAYGAVEGGVRLATPVGDADAGRAASLFASGRRQDGYRDHAGSDAFAVGGDIDLVAAPDDGDPSLSLSALTAYRDLERPGPLAGDELASRRRSSHPFFRFDRTEAWVHRLGLEGHTATGHTGTGHTGAGHPGAGLTASLAAELRRTDQVRTLPLAPEFADTKARDLEQRRLLGSVRHESGGLGITPQDRLVVGVDGSIGQFDSEHYEVASGPPDAYTGGAGERGALDARGEGSRRAAAAYLQYETRPVDALRISAGTRIDWLRDHHQPRFVAGDDRESFESDTRSHRAVSPRAGLNLRYVESARQRGHLYVTAGRSFKAPTPDQLYDQRSIPLPFPPFSATTANTDLDPQYGTHLELGVYHSLALTAGLAADVSASIYRMDMEDELDFDVEALHYVNIGESRHDGLELGVELSTPRGHRLFANWALQAATNELGEHEGRRLKAIPEHFVSAGASARLVDAFDAGVFVTRASGAWIDDANTIPLEPYTRVDARLGWSVAGRTVFVEAHNLFDTRYSTTGFPDPSGADVVYFHPAAGRTLRVGVRSR